MGELDGKVVLVTGGTNGMGLSHVNEIALAGGIPIAGDIVAADNVSAAMSVHLDVTDPASWERVVETVVDRFGRIDGLVNNAGIVARGATVDEHPLDDFERVVRVNQTGVFLGIKHVSHAMKSNGGSIVNISSNAGLEGIQGMPGYVASKWAVRGLTKSAALDLAKWSIRVNCVLPGSTKTAMMGDIDKPRRPQAVPRLGTPWEISQMVVFLLSDRSTYSTGADFVVDGGVTAGVVWEDDAFANQE